MKMLLLLHVHYSQSSVSLAGVANGALFVYVPLNPCESITACFHILFEVMCCRMLLKEVSCSGGVGEAMDFPPICLPWHFLSPQKAPASSASCSREFQ